MALSYPLFSATGWSNLELAGGDTSPNGNCCCVFFFKLDFSSPSVFLEDSCFFFFWGGWRARWCKSAAKLGVFHPPVRFIKPIDPFQSPRRMSDIISCKWTSFAYGHDPNGGTNESQWISGCENINGRYSDWPSFGEERFFYTLKAQPVTWS